MTHKRYLFEPALGGAATIAELGEGERPYVKLDQTWFHPQGGGQKADRGTIAGRPVLGVAHVGGDVFHYVGSVEGLCVGEEVAVEVDGGWRLANATLHTGGHLIAALVESRFPTLKAVGGHHWPDEARVEFAGDCRLTPEDLLNILNEDLARAVGTDLPVRVLFDDDANRTVKIGEYPAVPCGGTHVERTGLLIDCVGVKAKAKGGKLRVSYQV